MSSAFWTYDTNKGTALGDTYFNSAFILPAIFPSENGYQKSYAPIQRMSSIQFFCWILKFHSPCSFVVRHVNLSHTESEHN